MLSHCPHLALHGVVVGDELDAAGVLGGGGLAAKHVLGEAAGAVSHGPAAGPECKQQQQQHESACWKNCAPEKATATATTLPGSSQSSSGRCSQPRSCGKEQQRQQQGYCTFRPSKLQQQQLPQRQVPHYQQRAPLPSNKAAAVHTSQPSPPLMHPPRQQQQQPPPHYKRATVTAVTQGSLNNPTADGNTLHAPACQKLSLYCIAAAAGTALDNNHCNNSSSLNYNRSSKRHRHIGDPRTRSVPGWRCG